MEVCKFVILRIDFLRFYHPVTISYHIWHCVIVTGTYEWVIVLVPILLVVLGRMTFYDVILTLVQLHLQKKMVLD